MKNYIAVYYIDDYPDNGGGFKYEEFETEKELDDFVIDKYNFYDFHAIGKIERFKYKEVEVVTKVERDDSD